MSPKLLVVVGAGPGIGTHTAAQFASQGFSVALLSRNAQRLESDAAFVRKAASGALVKTFAADVADADDLMAALDAVVLEFGRPEVVLFNAARVAPSKIGEEPLERIVSDFKVTTGGLYTTSSWALENLTPASASVKPTILITGGGICFEPSPEHFALSLQKAAQVNLAKSVAYVAEPKGIHVATVLVNGVVTDDDPVINAANVAKVFWGLYGQEKAAWETLVDVGPRP